MFDQNYELLRITFSDTEQKSMVCSIGAKDLNALIMIFWG